MVYYVSQQGRIAFAVVTILFIAHNNLEWVWLEHCQGALRRLNSSTFVFTGLARSEPEGLTDRSRRISPFARTLPPLVCERVSVWRRWGFRVRAVEFSDDRFSFLFHIFAFVNNNKELGML